MGSEIIAENVEGAMKSIKGSKQVSDEEGPAFSKQDILKVLCNNGILDEAIVLQIFNNCDAEKTEIVKASILVDYLQNTAYGNHVTRNEFEHLLQLLDGNHVDGKITLESFKSALKLWIMEANVKKSLEHLSECENSKLQLKRSASSTGLPSPNSLLPHKDLNVITSIEALLKEHNAQSTKLQQDNKILREQVVDAARRNSTLSLENQKLDLKISRVKEELEAASRHSERLQEDNAEFKEHLQHVRDALQNLTEHYDDCRSDMEEKINTLQSRLEKSSAREEEHSKQLAENIPKLYAQSLQFQSCLSVMNGVLRELTQLWNEDLSKLKEKLSGLDSLLELNTVQGEAHIKELNERLQTLQEESGQLSDRLQLIDDALQKMTDQQSDRHSKLEQELRLLDSRLLSHETQEEEQSRQLTVNINELREDNGQLKGRLDHLESDVLKVGSHCNECRNEFESRVRTLQSNSAIEGERSREMNETIQKLEEKIELLDGRLVQQVSTSEEDKNKEQEELTPKGVVHFVRQISWFFFYLVIFGILSVLCITALEQPPYHQHCATNQIVGFIRELCHMEYPRWPPV